MTLAQTIEVSNGKQVEQVPHLKRWWILATMCFGTFMATLDSSIANVALPTIASELSSPLHTVQWVITAYLLTICATLPIIGKLSDLVGRTRVYNYGFLVFILGAMASALSPSLGILITARVFQAFGASCLMANSQAIVAETFAGSGRGRALGIIGMSVSVGSLSGPGIGGLLVGSFGWSSIFWVNVPIGLIGFIAGWFILPKEPIQKRNEPFDYLGSALFAGGMVVFLYTVSNASEWGWGTNRTFILGIVALFLLAGFFLWERKVTYPMLDFSLYRIPLFAMGNSASFLQFTSMFSMMVMMPFYMQNVLHFSPQVTGYTMMAYPCTMAIVAPVSGWLSEKIGPYVLTLGGLLINSFAFALLTTLSIHESSWMVALHLVLFGVGAGMFLSPNNSSIMGSVPNSKLGTAGGLNALIRNLGMVIGISLSVSLFSYRLNSQHSGDGGITVNEVGEAALMLNAMHFVFWTAMSICLVGVLICSLRFKLSKEDVTVSTYDYRK